MANKHPDKHFSEELEKLKNVNKIQKPNQNTASYGLKKFKKRIEKLKAKMEQIKRLKEAENKTEQGALSDDNGNKEE